MSLLRIIGLGFSPFLVFAEPTPIALGNPLRAITDANESSFSDSSVRTSMETTLDGASAKLSSQVEGERVSAAKLLGKYPVRSSSLILIRTLDDHSPLVRRAALVSLVEHYNAGQLIYDRALVEKIFSKIGDPDVEIRREVSALVPRLVPGLLQSGMEKFEINGRTVYRSTPGQLRPDLFELAQRGFLDSDSIVRQNLLRHHFSLRLQIHPQTMVKLLADEDPRVILVALDQVGMYGASPGVIDQILALTKHGDPGVRTKVCQTARNLARSFFGLRKVLRAMLNDSNSGICAQSALELARLGENLSESEIDLITNYLSSANGLDGVASKVFQGLSALGQDAVQVYRVLTSHVSARMRAQAWRHYLLQTNGWLKSSTWISALEDRDQEVRESVLVSIRGKVGALQENELGDLMASRYSDVRAFAAECFLMADQKLVEKLYMDLLIDENLLVRATTLRALANRRIAGWLKVHVRSLLDSNQAIQVAAMDGLVDDPKVGVPALIDFVREHPDKKISSLVREKLSHKGYRP